jgi:imidazolonepropionase-like amidohydrolase
MRSFRLVLALAASLSAALASGADKAAAPAKPTLALVGGQVIDGYEGPPIHDGVVLIAGERIVAVGRRGEVAVPPGTPVIDTSGMSVLPGLMDMHVHLMILGHSDYEYWDNTYMPRFGKDIMPIAARQLLMSGVTTVRDLGAPLEESLEVRSRIEKGEIPGPRLFVTGPFIQKKPYFPYEARVRWGVDGADDARGKVQKLVDAGVDFIKLID